MMQLSPDGPNTFQPLSRRDALGVLSTEVGDSDHWGVILNE